MASLYVMVGIPGSGKSTVAKKVASQKPGTVIVSSDELRAKYFGSEDTMYDNTLIQPYMDGLSDDEKQKEVYKKIAGDTFIFEKMDKICEKALKDGHDVIYDATNTRRVNRASTLYRFFDICDGVYIVYINCPLELALKRNSERERHVPEDVIRRMYTKMDIPEPRENAKRGYVSWQKDWTDVIVVNM